MRDRPRRSILGIALALGLGLQFAIVPPVAACSCMPPQPMAAYAGDDSNVILTGVTESRDARGYPVTVTRWFQGGGILEPRVWFDASGFDGQSASCGIDPLPAGNEWIFVAYRIESRDELGLNLCSPFASLGDATGQTMLAEAAAAFGGEGVPPSATDPPDPPAVAIPPVPDNSAVVVPILIALVAAAGVVLGVFAIVGRRRDSEDEPRTD